MDIELKIEELEKKIDNNMNKIIKNMNKLHSHEDKINENANNIQKNSYALEILRDMKKENNKSFIIKKRLLIILIIVLFMWFATIGYLVYILNDIGTEEIITETTTQEVSEVGSIDNSYIINGDNNEGKTN